MEKTNDKEIINLLDSLSETDSEISDLVLTQRKKKVKRRSRLRVRSKSGNSCGCGRSQSRIAALWLAAVLITFWLIALSWLAAVLYSEIGRIDVSIRSGKNFHQFIFSAYFYFPSSNNLSPAGLCKQRTKTILPLLRNFEGQTLLRYTKIPQILSFIEKNMEILKNICTKKNCSQKRFIIRGIFGLSNVATENWSTVSPLSLLSPLRNIEAIELSEFRAKKEMRNQRKTILQSNQLFFLNGICSACSINFYNRCVKKRNIDFAYIGDCVFFSCRILEKSVDLVIDGGSPGRTLEAVVEPARPICAGGSMIKEARVDSPSFPPILPPTSLSHFQAHDLYSFSIFFYTHNVFFQYSMRELIDYDFISTLPSILIGDAFQYSGSTNTNRRIGFSYIFLYRIIEQIDHDFSYVAERSDQRLLLKALINENGSTE